MFRFYFSTYKKAALSIVALLSILFIPFMQHVHAHAYSASFTKLNLTKQHTELIFSIDGLSARELSSGDMNKSNMLDQKELDEFKDKFESIISEKVILKINGESTPWTQVESVTLDHKGNTPIVVLKAVFPPVSASQSVSMADQLYLNDSNTNYVNLLTVNYGSKQSTAAISGKDRTWDMILSDKDYAGLGLGIQQSDSTGESQNGGQPKDASGQQHSISTSGWLSFFKLGMNHIITGYDHLLFLFSLLIARQMFKQYATMITAFTIAHSLTLTLTVLGIIDVPGWIVEPAIALSICYVAIDNIFNKNVSRRWVLTFIFGLIHGMGFADILQEMDIPRKELAIDLTSFNLGIEAVQIIIVSAVLPLIYLMHRWNYSRRAVIAASSAAFVLGGIWLIQRVFA